MDSNVGCCNNSSSEDRSSKRLHILMFPWFARSHFSSYAELSNRLADRGINISFLTTPLNVPKIKPLFVCSNQNSPGKVQIVELPLPAVEGLPTGVECTADTPPHLLPLLLRALHLLEGPFKSLLLRLAPDVVVFDLVRYWTPRVATKLGIPTILFLSFGAAYSSYHLSPRNAQYGEITTAEDLIVPPPGYPSSKISWRPFEAQFTFKKYYTRDDTDGTRYIDRKVNCIDGCEAIAIKSCYEFEGKFIEYFEQVSGKPVIPVGPLLQSRAGSLSVSECLKWLGTQSISSVVYASFGTEYFLSNEEIQEVALGLESSQQPFLLVLTFAGHGDGSTSLPEGFEERIGDKGLVFTDWAPQREILSHPSTGAFLTHCGWSSLMEGMSVGLPLIALPKKWDQGLNARLIVNELKVGVEVARQIDGEASREDICRAVRAVMEGEGEEGREVRQRALQMRDLFTRIILDGESKGSEELYIDKFVQHLLALATAKGGHGFEFRR